MRFGNKKKNGRSVLAGKSWETAREKLRGAAAGTRKNPPKGDLQVMREFMSLLRDDDPAGMTMAEDLLLESGITLARAGRWPTGDPMTGLFILDDPKPVRHFSDPLQMVGLGPIKGLDDSRKRTAAGWKIEQIAPKNFIITFEYWWDGQRDTILSGGHYHSLESAQRVAASDAWVIAKALKTMPAGMDVRTRATSAHAGELAELEAPLQLMREEFDATNLDEHGRFAMRRNPTAPQEALDKYEEFHRYKPTKIGAFGRGFEIPGTMYLAGDARWTTYRSGKVDPSTLQKPRRPVNYIHEHEAGVSVYLPMNGESRKVIVALPKIVQVPREFEEVEALVKLGDSLGFCFELPDGEEVEAESTDPLPELYCSPDGRCLYVVQGKKEVLAMVWGGGLGVFARGIDG